MAFGHEITPERAAELRAIREDQMAAARKHMIMPTGTPAQVRAALRQRLHDLTGVKT